jgi:hypothetical protein
MALFTRNARYFLALPALLTLLPLCWLHWLPSPRWRRVLTVALLTLGALNLSRAQLLQERLATPAPFALGRAGVEEYTARVSPMTRVLHEASRTLPIDATVLLVGESRALYLGRRGIWSAVHQPSPLVMIHRQAEEEGKRIPEVLRAHGVTHILLSAREGVRYDRQGHFRELGGSPWRELTLSLPREGPILEDPREGIWLWALGDPPKLSEGKDLAPDPGGRVD